MKNVGFGAYLGGSTGAEVGSKYGIARAGKGYNGRYFGMYAVALTSAVLGYGIGFWKESKQIKYDKKTKNQ